MERHQLEYFTAAMEHGSLTRAAAALRVSQPALSRAIKNLERELGTQLFRRTGRAVIPTSAAQQMIVHTRRILRDMSDLATVAAAESGPAGRVEVATTPSTAIEPMTSAVRRLQDTHPAISITCLQAPNASAAIEAVENGRCEVGLCGTLTTPSGRHVIAEQLGTTEIMVVVHRDSPLADLSAITAADLRGQPMIIGPPDTTTRTVFDQLDAEIGGLQSAVEVGHREAIVPMVVAGVGHALLSSAWQRLAEQAGAQVRPLRPAVAVPYWLLTRPQLAPATEAVVRALRHARA